MNQNINLIEELDIKPISVFSSKLFLQVSVCWILVLILTYALGISIDSIRQRKLSTLEATQKSLTEKLAAYNQELMPYQGPDLKDKKKKDAKDQKKTIPLGSLNLEGFYLYLEDLSRYTPNGVWLKGITLSEKDSVVTITGSSIGAYGVSTFLNALNRSIRLKNKSFNTIVMKTDPTTKNVDFIISSITTSPKPKTQEQKGKNEPVSIKI